MEMSKIIINPILNFCFFRTGYSAYFARSGAGMELRVRRLLDCDELPIFRRASTLENRIGTPTKTRYKSAASNWSLGNFFGSGKYNSGEKPLQDSNVAWHRIIRFTFMRLLITSKVFYLAADP
ncbi:MAG: hypothetical protein HYR49_11190 [Gammaproteobacteria bacterium]|nr:hypothetical protein [Gammaproteobacteria bacterium]